jgi:RNA polymerase sigma-70 factor (ECF subfamily)
MRVCTKNHADPDETTLIQRAQQGDSAALGALYELHVDAVYKFMYYRTGDEMVAEDLTAETFAHVIQSLERYEDRGLPFGAWVFRIARARLADYWRRTKRRERYDALLGRRESVDEVEFEALDDRFEFQIVRQALTYLTQAEYEVVSLRFVGGLSNREIAEIVHSNANAVKSRMHRAMHKLREILERKMAFEDEGVDR